MTSWPNLPPRLPAALVALAVGLGTISLGLRLDVRPLAWLQVHAGTLPFVPAVGILFVVAALNLKGRLK